MTAPSDTTSARTTASLRKLLAVVALGGLLGTVPACGNVDSNRAPAALAATITAAPAVAAEPRRHPGHYVSLNRTDELNVVAELRQPGIRGFQRRHTWRTLEPNAGEYDFSAIRRDLAVAARHKLQYVVLIEDKTFTEEIPTPAYLEVPPATLKNRNRGYTAARWRPEVAGAFRDLVVELGRTFDDHPNFEGIGIQETALSLTDEALRSAQYSAAAYQQTLSALLEAGSGAMTRGNVFWYMNFLPARQKGLADIIAKTVIGRDNIIVGGPDVLPGKPALTRHTYPLYEQFSGQATFFNSMQFDSYAHPRNHGPQTADAASVQEAGAASREPRYWTLAELTEFARDELGVSYLFWNRKTWRKPADSYAFEDALPVFSRYATLARAHDRPSCAERDCPSDDLRAGADSAGDES